MGYAVLRKGPDMVATKHHGLPTLEPGVPYKSYHPDCLDDEQYNIIIEVPGRGALMVQSIDFDFMTDEEVETEASEEAYQRMMGELDMLQEAFEEKAAELAGHPFTRDCDAITIISDVIVEKGFTIITNEQYGG